MATGGIRLPFKLLGIPVLLDFGFLLALPLFAYLIGSQLPGYVSQLARLGIRIDPTAFADGPNYLLGFLGAVGLFASVLVHELGHAVTARLYGIRTKEIRLWLLGGLAQFEELPKQRGGEALVALAGPVTSALLSALLWLLAPLAQAAGTTVVLSYLAITNSALAIFNLLPALPLDGGRILRSVLALFLPHLRATRIAVAISGAVAITMGIYGILWGQMFLVVMAFFVYTAGRAEAQAAVITGAFEGRTVGELMTRDPLSVEPGMTLEQFARMADFRRFNGYPVTEADGRLVGYARLADGAAELQRQGAAQATVATIMRPAETATAGQPAMEALRRLSQSELGRLAVVDGSGRLIGILSKTDLLTLFRPPTGAAGR